MFYVVDDENKLTNLGLRFLLVKLHMDTLRSQPTKGHLQEALLGLGKGIGRAGYDVRTSNGEN